MTRLSRLEIICGLAWFFSDGCWLMEWVWPCYIAGLMAVAAGAGIFWLQERKPITMLVCGADSSWLLFNILWSFGDLAQTKLHITDLDWSIVAAKCFFFIGIALYGLAFIENRGKIFDLVLRRLRLLRLLSR